MKHIGTARWINFFAMLLALPTAYFILVAVLKFEMNINAPYDSIAPFLERSGIRESIGWNINLLILFGPLLAGILSIAQVLNLQISWTEKSYNISVDISKKWWTLAIGVFSALLIGFLLLYAIGENCNCH